MTHQNDFGDGSARKKRGLLSRFRRSRDGSVAIEFTMLAIPFSLLIFAVLESCISFGAEQVLVNVTEKVARQVRTGQLRPADLSDSSLKTLICADLSIFVAAGCPDLAVDLQSYPTFTDAAAVRIKFTSDNDIDTTGFKVAPGPSQSKNMLRVFYRWPVMTNLLAKQMSNLKNNKTLLFATVTWQNEPFDD